MWKHLSGMFDDVDFDSLLRKIEPLVMENVVTAYGKEYQVTRRSCKFSDDNIDPSLFSYGNTSLHKWKSSSIIRKVKREIEEKLKFEPFDYCLVHLYPDGESSIAWHNDKEALNTPVVSVSFGATRKFRFRRLGETKGWDKEFLLKHGDVFIMKAGCQKKFVHTIPKELKIKEPRINFTFRYE